MIAPHSPEKSAAERAHGRRLPSKVTERDISKIRHVAEHMSSSIAKSYLQTLLEVLDSQEIQLVAAQEALAEALDSNTAATERATKEAQHHQDSLRLLNDATERAEKAEQDAAECRSLRDVAVQALERRTKEMLAAEERAERAERELEEYTSKRAIPMTVTIADHPEVLSIMQAAKDEIGRLRSELATSRAAHQECSQLAVRLTEQDGEHHARALEAEQALEISRAALDRTRQDADALLAQIPRWRPIESAPKDGSRFLAWSERGGIATVFWREAYGYWSVCCSGDRTQPTHWMPLPLPPKETT